MSAGLPPQIIWIGYHCLKLNDRHHTADSNRQYDQHTSLSRACLKLQCLAVLLLSDPTANFLPSSWIGEDDLQFPSRLASLNSRLWLWQLNLGSMTSPSWHFAFAGPGISSYASVPLQAGESLRACMQEAEQRVPSKRHQETPLYLGATAGMRLLKYGKRVHTHSPIIKHKTYTHKKVTQHAYTWWHWGDRIPSLHSVIVFALAVELLSVAFSIRLLVIYLHSNLTARAVNKLLSNPLYTTQYIHYLWAAVLIWIMDVSHSNEFVLCVHAV